MPTPAIDLTISPPAFPVLESRLREDKQSHLFDADGTFGPGSDVETFVLQKGGLVVPVNHDSHARRGGQQRDMVFLLHFENEG